MINHACIRLFSAFNAGYSIPQFCIDNGYKHPMIAAESPELLYIIYEQFWFNKKISAQYRIIGEPTVLKAYAGILIGELSVSPFSAENCGNADIVLYLSDKTLNQKISAPILTLIQIAYTMTHYVFWERPLYNFINLHPGVKVITYSHPDLIENDYNTELEKRVLSENIKGQLIEKRRNGNTEEIWTPLDEFGYTNAEVLRLLDMPAAKTDWRGCTHFDDSNDELFNSKDGKRMTAYQPETYKHVIYMLGTCVCVGYAAPWDKSMPSYLQEILNDNNEEYLVENISQFYNRRYQDIFYNLNALPLKDGDIVFICLANVSVRDIPSFYARNLFKRPHNYGEIYVDNYHINERGYKIVAEKFYEFLKENQLL